MKVYIAWILASVLIIDFSINMIIPEPINNIKPSKLSLYFDYGRSIERKLFRKVADNNESADSLAKAGWFKKDNITSSHGNNVNKLTKVYIYGMSFSQRLGKIIAQLDSNLDVRIFGGPGAPLNHSYTYFKSHRPHEKGSIIIIGVLASSLPMVNTLTHMTSSFEGPAAHFYPRYRLDKNNKLTNIQMPINSLSELRNVMHNDQQWNVIKQSLKKHDSFYNQVLFEENFTDSSVYLRLIKRAWGQRHKFKMLERYHDQDGFKNSEKLINVSQAILTEFAKNARNDDVTPLVVLFNNRSFSDHLYKALRPALDENNISYYSTHKDFPADNLSNFITDGHFTAEIDKQIAMKVLKIIHDKI